MGTAAEKAHRAAYVDHAALVEKAMASGAIRSDTDLQNFLISIGQKPDGPLYKRYYSEGGYAIYGPAWDPGRKFDFEHGQDIPVTNDPKAQPWYDSSNPDNWTNTDPSTASRMAAFYNWRGTPEGAAANAAYGGNSLAAMLHMRAQSSQPNAPDLRFLGQPAGYYEAIHPPVTAGQSNLATGPLQPNYKPLGTGGTVTGKPAGVVPYNGRTGPIDQTTGVPYYPGYDKLTNYKYDNVNTAINPAVAPGMVRPRSFAENRRRRTTTGLY